MIPKWKDINDQLEASNISHDVVEKLRILTAAPRHLARCQAAWQAALEWTGGDEAKAAALCYCESKGLYGGGLQHPGAGTTRHRAFEKLGKGRRNASDGNAWTQSIAAAPSLGGWHLTGWHCEGQVLSVVVTGPGDVYPQYVDAKTILSWYEIEVLLCGLVLDQWIDPISAAPVLQWCRDRCEEEQHESQTA